MLGLEDHARLLEQIGLHARADDVMTPIEVDLNELAESRRVVVASGLGIAERLHDRIRRQHFLLDLGLFGRAAHVREIAHRVLGRHGFARARLATHNDRLILFET